MPATTIWMGDLLACLNELAPADDNTAEAIAGLLGFERIAGPARRPASPVPSASPEQPTPFVPETPAAVPDGVGPSAPAQVASPSSAAAPLPSAAPPAKPRREEMVPDGAGPSASAWVAPPSFPVDRLPPIAPRWSPDTRDDTVTPLRLTEVDSSPPLAPVPLLSPLAGRFIVQELIISRRPGPVPDIDRLVEAMARGEIPQPIPWQESRTLARGAQVLVDYGEGMEPFAGDQRALVELVRRLAGEALVEVQTIHESPDPRDPVDPWTPPPPGTPVLALTDLGLAGRIEQRTPDLVAAWRSAASTLARRGSSLTVLTPYPPARYPTPLASAICLVRWDRPTTTAQARRVRREGPSR